MMTMKKLSRKFTKAIKNMKDKLSKFMLGSKSDKGGDGVERNKKQNG